MATVYPAEAYRSNALGSFGNASYMLIRQHQFPCSYDENRDVMAGQDHDRILEQKYEHGRRCFTQHTGTGELAFENWVTRATPEQVLEFLKDILEADNTVTWTGFRILGTVNRSSGYTVWSLLLFAKHPQTTTEVFDGKNAPDLIFGSRYAR